MVLGYDQGIIDDTCLVVVYFAAIFLDIILDFNQRIYMFKIANSYEMIMKQFKCFFSGSHGIMQGALQEAGTHFTHDSES